MAGKYQQLKAQIAKLEKEAAAARKVEAAEAVATIKALMGEFGLTVEDLGLKAGRKAAKARGAGIPKYRDPQSGKTWTGRGKPPAWMAQALKDGTGDALLIKGEAAPADGTGPKPARRRKSAAPSPAVPTSAKKRGAKAPAAKSPGAKAVKRPRKKAGATSSSTAAPALESSAAATAPAGDGA